MIEGIRRAAEASARAAATLRAEVIKAHAAGANVTELARAAGVTRQTIYRWTEDHRTLEETKGEG